MTDKVDVVISCTARQARIGDLVEIFGFVRVQPNDVLPSDVPVQIQLSQDSVLRKWQTLQIVKTRDGGYYQEITFPDGTPLGNYVIQALVTNPTTGETFTSLELPITIGSAYIPASNTHIQDPITFDDEYKMGWATNLVSDILVKKPPFTATNTWLFFAFGTSLDGLHEATLIHGFDVTASPIETGAGGFNLAILRLDGVETSVRFNAPFRFTSAMLPPRPPYPAIYSDPNGEAICIQGFNEARQAYYIEVASRDGKYKIVMNTKALGPPFWLARKFDNMIWIERRPEGKLEYMGLFVSMAKLDMTITMPQYPNGLIFDGIVGVDREWHGTVFAPPTPFKMKQSYTAFYAVKPDDFWLVIWKAYDPSKNWQIFSQSGLIHFIKRNQTFRFDDFKITDDGGLKPTKYYLKGKSNDGSIVVNLACDIKAHMFHNQGADNECFTRPIGKWHGTIQTPTETITVDDAYGVGEERRTSLSARYSS